MAPVNGGQFSAAVDSMHGKEKVYGSIP